MLHSAPFLVDVLNPNVSGTVMFPVLCLLANRLCENGIKEVVHHLGPPMKQEKQQINHSLKTKIYSDIMEASHRDTKLFHQLTVIKVVTQFRMCYRYPWIEG